MSKEYSVYSEVDEIQFFNKTLDNLAKELFHEDNNLSTLFRSFTTEKRIKKSAFIASVLASSPDEKHKKKALAFAILAYTKYKGEEKEDLYKRYLYIILSRIGDLPAIGSFVSDEERKEFDRTLLTSFDSVLSTELDSYRETYRYDEEHYISEFQKDILEVLSDGDDVAISGPTSSGKSFILQKFIERKNEEKTNFEVIYVVPTRALISEVSTDLKDQHENITVKSSANFTEEDKSENVFLVVTPERCLKLLREEMKDNIDPDLVFFDEFQKIEDGERGILFENVIESLKEMWPSAQVVVAGPYLEDPAEELEQVTGEEVQEVTTIFTPILQLKILLTFERQKSGDRKLKVSILSPSGNNIEFEITEPDGMTFSKFNQNKGEFLKKALQEFGEDSQNLIYASQKNWAENWTYHIAQGREARPPSDEMIALQDFLARSIHEDYTLIECLEHGIAFHHRMVPQIARTKVEQIYRDESDIDTIVSTPTLLEGVNLPAENIFIHDPSKGRENLSNFDFKNLIGRVGRLNKKLYGSIYCLQTEDDEWSQEKLDDTENKKIEPATDKAMQKDIDDLVNVVGRENIHEEKEDHLRYTGILLRNKYQRSEKELNEYLSKKDVEDGHADQIKKNIKDRMEGIKIPEKIFRRNPTIDPVQQDKLYKSVREQPSDWIIAESRSDYSYENFLEVTKKLNRIFHFANVEDGITPDDSEIEQKKLIHVTIPADQWLKGDSFRSMIEDREDNPKIDDGEINGAIRNVMEIVNDDIRFVLVKYYRILTDILEEAEATDSEWMLTFDQMLEMGSVKFNEIELMSMGVDRSVVIDLPIPPNVDNVVKFLNQNQNLIQDFYLDHLEEQGVI